MLTLRSVSILGKLLHLILKLVLYNRGDTILGPAPCSTVLTLSLHEPAIKSSIHCWALLITLWTWNTYIVSSLLYITECGTQCPVMIQWNIEELHTKVLVLFCISLHYRVHSALSIFSNQSWVLMAPSKTLAAPPIPCKWKQHT